MTQPLMLLHYERLFPGTHLVNRLQDLGYRVLTHADPATLVRQAEKEKPLLVLADVGVNADLVCAAIDQLRRKPVTSHLPVVVIAPARDKATQTMARTAGATLVVSDQAILRHLGEFLEQALQIE